jgi:hypothetical protein
LSHATSRKHVGDAQSMGVHMSGNTNDWTTSGTIILPPSTASTIHVTESKRYPHAESTSPPPDKRVFNRSNLSSPHLVDGWVPTPDMPSQPNDEGSTTFHGLSHAERGSTKARETRLRVPARPSQVNRDRSPHAAIASGTTSGNGQVNPVGAKASSSSTRTSPHRD